MLQFLKSVLPRIQQFSKTLDHVENFVDLPWVLIDEEGNRHVYIFQRNKSLIMSLSGKAQVGKWEYIPAARSLLIDRGADKILLNHGFVSKGIMILRLDGRDDFPWVLANEKEIPDLDVSRYLKEFAIREMQLKTVTHNGILYYFSDPNDSGISNSSVFYDENLTVIQPTLRLLRYGRVYNIHKGELVESYYNKQYSTDKGWIDTRSMNRDLTVGDEVYLNDSIAPDDYYILGNHAHFSAMTIVNGRIERLTSKQGSGMDTSNVMLVLAVIVTIIFLVALLMINKPETPPSATGQESSSTQEGWIDTATIQSADTTATVYFSDEDCKQTVNRFLDAINTRDYVALQGFFPTVVPKYYKDRNLLSTHVVANIKQYDEGVVESISVFDTSEVTINRIGGMYIVKGRQIQLSTKSTDGIPMVYVSTVSYELTPELKISSVSGQVDSKDFNYRKLLGVPESDLRPVEEILKNPTAEDFDRIFFRMVSTEETQQFKDVLRDAVLQQFGKETPVYTNGTSNYVTLEMLVESLTSGVTRYVTTNRVMFTSSNQISQLTVSY